MVEYHCWQGGGGYGDPLERDPALVAQDVRARLVSPPVAREVYGVVIAEGRVNEAATRERRESIRRGRLARGRLASEILVGAMDADEPPLEGPETRGTGRLRYGDLLEFDFGADRIRCLACGRELGSARGDFRLGCLVERAPVTAAGPGRGEDYDAGRIELRLYYCPGCGRQLETQVALREGHPPSGFRLFGSAGAGRAPLK
jgi:N-methylhydantoinase B